MNQKQTETPIRYSIRFKIFLVSLLPTIALLAAAFLNNQYLSDLGDSAEQILSKNYKSIRAAQEARKTLEELRNRMLEQVSGRQGIIVIPAERLQNLSDNLNICRRNVTEIGEQEMIDRLYDGFDRYETLARTLKEDRQNSWSGDRFTGFLEITAEMINIIENLVAINENAMEHAEHQTRLLAGRAQQQAAILFGVIITAILALSYFWSFRIAKPIMALAQQISGIQEGTGTYPMIPSQTNDEIGFLRKSFNRLLSRLEQYDHHRDEILATEREKVRRSEEAKGRFIADISHQLKTPMTSLAMSVGMLNNRGESLAAEKRIKLCAMANEDCSRLTALINELVDISRLEAMSRPRPKETLDIAVVIRECLAPLIKQTEKKEISIDLRIPDNLPRVTIDSFRFPWVITNLVGNALRYIDQGGRIVLKVYKQGTRFYFQCSDTGSGIDPDYLPYIFDRFTQFSERGKSGTIGLGLAIVKDIIEQHGGDIQVESSMGKGTTFTFWIPVSMEEKA
ncbi:MAG: sensor histidine kinase [Desulfobacteraceae bacterium]|nr:MAG: sensor histidine kinase [Desulfobacteraceae bacterium]